jgi:CubicO group peptidase (beta-lactamase class C family)
LILNVLLAAVLALACFAPALATPVADVDFAGLDAFVHREMQAASIPGLAYGIVQDGRVIHLAAFGLASREDGRPMTPQTPMLINSVGKTITALAVRQLINAGKIGLDAPVQRYLPWFALATPGAAEQITIRHLLNHTSGLSRGDGQNPAHYRAGLTAEQVVRSLATVKVDRPVGSRGSTLTSTTSSPAW